jgi:hypothetical protein
MSRNLTTATANAFAAQVVQPVFLLRVEFPSGTVRLHSGIGNLTFNSETYTGTGGLGGISPVTESLDGSANNLVVALTASSAIISLALTEDPRGRQAALYLGAVSLSTGLLIADPQLRYRGRVNYVSHQDNGETAMVALNIVHERGDQERPLERRLTNEIQQQLHPGDLGLEYVADLPNQQFTWGNATVAAATPGGPVDAPVDNENIYVP